jgi:integrase
VLTQAKNQANNWKIDGLKPSGVSIWSYKTKKGTRWAFEARYKSGTEVIKKQKRGFFSKPECISASTQVFTSSQAISDRREPLCFSDLIERYVSDLEGKVAETSRANYFHLLNLYTPHSLLINRASKISPSDIQDVLAQLSGSGIRAGTVNTYRARLSALFNFAIRSGECVSNPVASVRRATSTFVNSSAVAEPWSTTEVHKAIIASTNTQLETFIHLAIYAGLRKGEILALTWNDIDLDRAVIRVEKSLSQRRFLVEGRIKSIEQVGGPKTPSSIRTIPLSAATVSFLSEVRERSMISLEGHVVSRGDGRPFPISSLGKQFRALCSLNGLRPIRIHDLRHTSAVLSLMGNAPLEAVSEALGHKSVEVTKRFYAKRVSTYPALFVAGVHEALAIRDSSSIR